MADLTSLCALGGLEPRLDTSDGLTLVERPDFALATVAAHQGRGPATREAVSTLIGAEVPGPGRMAGHTFRAIWTGPDQWLIEAPYATHADIVPALRSAMGDDAILVEQTDAWVRLDLTGDDVVPVLERLSNLDHRRMAVGSAMFTTIHHLRCLLLREAGRVAFYGPRASARTLHHAVLTAMRAA